MSEVINIIDVPEDISNRIKVCWKCGKKAVVTKIEENYNCHLYKWIRISCQDEKCNNFIHFDDADKLEECHIKEWNKKNIEKYVPKSELKESKQNCRHCKYVDRCVNAREQRIAQFFDAHVCDDFKHE